MVPVARETRQRIYAVSPAFAELRPYLEGEVGRQWELATARSYPDIYGEIAGGWFMWALRQAVDDAGRADRPKAAHHFYAQMADQINAACDSGRLPAWPRSDSLVPRWRHGFWKRTWQALRPNLWGFVSFENPKAELFASKGGAKALAQFQAFVRSPLSDRRTTGFDEARLRLIGRIAAAWELIGPVWFCASALAFIPLCIISVGGRRPPLLVAGGAMLVAVVTRLCMLALIDATSFPALMITYLSCVYPALLLFAVVTTLEFVHQVRRMIIQSRARAVSVRIPHVRPV